MILGTLLGTWFWMRTSRYCIIHQYQYLDAPGTLYC